METHNLWRQTSTEKNPKRFILNVVEIYVATEWLFCQSETPHVKIK